MEFWNSAFDELPDIVFVFDQDGRILKGNKAFHEAVGSASENECLNFAELFDLSEDIIVQDIVEQSHGTRASSMIVESLLRRGDGHRPTVDLHCKRMDFAGNTKPAMIATGRVTSKRASISGPSEGERKFRRLADAAPVAIYQADAEGKITYVNEQWAKRLGYSQEELLGFGWQRFVVDTKVYRDDPPWIGFTPENDFRIRTNRFRKVDGELIEFQTMNQAEFSSDGELLGFVGVMFDVTEQARALRDYEQSEKRFSAFASLSSVGIFRADAKGNLFFANDKWSEISGIGIKEAMNEGWVSAIHPEDRKRVVDTWHSVIENSEGQARFRFEHPSGEIRHVEVVATAETEVAGRIHGYIGIVVDVTRNEETAEQLRQRENQLALLAAHSRDPIFRLDLEGRCIYASPAAEMMLDAKAGDLIGDSMIEKCHEDDLPKFLEAFRSLASGSRDLGDVTFRAQSPRPPHDYHWMEAQGVLVRDANGDASEVFVSLRDVTAQRQLEDRLQDAREAAERSASSKASFLANMSHEIRTPMNGVLGYADLLASSELTDEQREYVELIRDSGKSMMHLLNDVLDFSKIEAGQLSITKKVVDLPHMLNSTAKLVRPQANQKELKFEVLADANLPRWIVTDQMRLRQILTNLLSNAVKFTSDGFVRLSAAQDGSELAISVTDSGCGISPQRIESVFESFAQENASTHLEFGGTGLGLAISRSLAELMGGSLSVESEKGTGSTFTLRLPLEVAETPVDRSIPQGAKSAAVEFEGKILVAEDHPVNQALISAMLTKLGVAFDVVGDGAAALEAVTEANSFDEPYRLILMDIEMPVMNGVACAQKLRSEGVDGQELPIIALTANAFPEDIETYLEAGMQSHLGKPLRLDDLVKELRAWN